MTAARTAWATRRTRPASRGQPSRRLFRSRKKSPFVLKSPIRARPGGGIIRQRRPSKRCGASLRKPRPYSTLDHSIGRTHPPFAHVSKDMIQRHFDCMVFSPVYGVVDYIDVHPSRYEIGVYLRGYNDVTYDPHSIFAPLSGTIQELSYQSKSFMRMLRWSSRPHSNPCLGLSMQSLTCSRRLGVVEAGRGALLAA